MEGKEFIMKILLVLIGLCFLQGCTTAIKTIEVLNRPEPKTPLNLDMPETLSLAPIEWIIITPENAEEVWAKLAEDPKGEVVLFALNESGYEELAKNYASIRTALAEHRNVIIAYRDYYEPITVEELPPKK
jgi:hypothetical protein|tara:strand:- start:39 stop:431 length:393 start_codon:yes stop_codon:yes gene_type:complete